MASSSSMMRMLAFSLCGENMFNRCSVFSTNHKVPTYHIPFSRSECDFVYANTHSDRQYIFHVKAVDRSGNTSTPKYAHRAVFMALIILVAAG